MKRSAAFLFLFVVGCSTAPLANFLDFVKPGKLGPERVAPYGGVCNPHPVGSVVAPAGQPGFPPAPTPVPAGAPGFGTAPPPLAQPATPAFGAPPPPAPSGTIRPTSDISTTPATMSSLGISAAAAPMPSTAEAPAPTPSLAPNPR